MSAAGTARADFRLPGTVTDGANGNVSNDSGGGSAFTLVDVWGRCASDCGGPAGRAGPTRAREMDASDCLGTFVYF